MDVLHEAANLFDAAQACLTSFIGDLAAYGIDTAPDLRVHHGEGPLSSYNLQDGKIYLSLPDPNNSLGKLKLLFLKSMSCAESNEDLLRFLQLFMPPIIAHELGHHLRQYHGLFGDNLWYEEQVANQIAMALTKRRLWRHIMFGEEDSAAANTLTRLRLLDQSDIYRSLPAEHLLDLLHDLRLVILATGETIIWEGTRHGDVFILIEGSLEALVSTGEGLKRIATIQPGEVLGEIAFFTHAPRTATVRAVQPSQCFALKGTDLKRFGFKNPSVLMQMAGALAQRLLRQVAALAETQHA